MKQADATCTWLIAYNAYSTISLEIAWAYKSAGCASKLSFAWKIQQLKEQKMLGARKVHKLHVNISESPMRNSDRAGMNFHSSLRSLPNKKVDLHRFAPIQSSQLAARLKPSPCRNSICYEGELVQCSPHEDRNGRTTSQSIRRLHVPPKCIRTSIHASPFLPIFS